MLRVGELFAGIGGFSKGLEDAGGFETVFFCEKDKFCQKVLRKHWPDVEVFDDVTNLKYKKNVDLVTAGFPCQDISLAGEGAGLSGDRSGLFWYILRTLCMVGRPRVLLENVAALLNRGLCTVLGSLASFGYDAEWHCIPASSIGLPHTRDRVWIMANPASERWTGILYNELRKREKQTEKQKTIALDTSRNLEERCRREIYGEPPIFRGNNGLPNRVDRLRSLGNAVVPQIPEIIGNAILEVENDTRTKT